MVNYTHNIQWRDTAITLPRGADGAYNLGEGVFVWSYEGEELDFINLKKCSTSNPVSSSLAMHDSALYICGGLIYNTQFADTLIHPAGNSIAYIARYDMAGGSGGSGGSGNDTIPADTGSVSITTVGDDGAIMVYPNPATHQVTVRVQNPAFNIQHCYLADMLGRREEVRLTAAGNGQYTLDLGARPQATYLLTITADDGRQHTVRLLKRSDGLGD